MAIGRSELVNVVKGEGKGEEKPEEGMVLDTRSARGPPLPSGESTQTWFWSESTNT